MRKLINKQQKANEFWNKKQTHIIGNPVQVIVIGGKMRQNKNQAAADEHSNFEFWPINQQSG